MARSRASTTFSTSTSASTSTCTPHTLRGSELDKAELEAKGAGMDVACNKEAGFQVSISEIPRRKPVPPQKDPASLSPAVGEHWQQTTKPSLYSRLSAIYASLDTRKKRIVLGVAALIVIALLALIIGLAVGLTVGKKGGAAANLPLPTDNGGPYVGDLTYYDPGLGACGIMSSNSDDICAVSKDLYDAASVSANPNDNPLCGLRLRLKREGKSVDVTVVDRCVGCKPTDIDVSRGVFERLAMLDQGRVLVEWAWLDKAPVAVPQV
ncbi:hypothetical protein VTO42DRAFT_7602 [Malbranchea cinnamomea]